MTKLIEGLGLTKLYPTAGGVLHAVDTVNISISHGESVGLVGESGCGKSTLTSLLARLIEPTFGTLHFEDTDILSVPVAAFARRPERSAIQKVFQDPGESLNPALTIFGAVADPVRCLLPDLDRKALTERVYKTFDDVNLPRELGSRYPHQLSGGQAARAGIARALVLDPKLLILDEPTSALDVSVQSVILQLLDKIQRERGMSFLFVSHDMNVVRLICQRIVVMYLGKTVETGTTEEIFKNPKHPYTQALLAAIPDPTRRGQNTQRLEGLASSPINPNPNACRFAGRCPVEIDICSREAPSLTSVGSEHAAACHLLQRHCQVKPA